MSLDQLDEKLSEAIYDLVEEQQFVPPLYVAVLAANGEAMVVHYKVASDLESLEAEIVAEHLPDGRMRLPVNLLFVDSRGQAARMRIDPDAADWVH
ncbi:MAG: hypothetical protein GWN84_12430 [Gammaproteobacteria bacterium]|nr:hypothetical protein [Gammaproteobacteria bacterium]NIR83713.1 hypothetical protein [Gammaproteobacteria bacterium]NIR91860.1 hypothetical protein [Gammaproteobacteria bacterium]NIU04879.1 hypothetical protein [Gammaproteobacteria bacterium]NIV51861.1 hypothetical protein [Gammaproteobacteria bacterium]